MSLAFLGNTYFRSYKDLQQDITTNSREVLKNIGVIRIIHDSSIAKAVGGQLVTNKAINGELMLTSSFQNHWDEHSSLDNNQVRQRDDFCREFDCLHLFQPVYKFFKLFGYSKEGNQFILFLVRTFPLIQLHI